MNRDMPSPGRNPMRDNTQFPDWDHMAHAFRKARTRYRRDLLNLTEGAMVRFPRKIKKHPPRGGWTHPVILAIQRAETHKERNNPW